MLAGAILDRLLHNAAVLNIQGRSYRLKELDAQLQQQTAARSGLLAKQSDALESVPEATGSRSTVPRPGETPAEKI